MSEKFEGGTLPQERKEEEKRLEIEELRVLREIPEFSGRSYDSFHGAIGDTKGLVVHVKFNQPVVFGGYQNNTWEIMVLLAEYLHGGPKYSEHGGSTAWQITDIKALEGSGRYSATFEIIAPSSKDNNSILEELEKKLIDDKGNLLNRKTTKENV